MEQRNLLLLATALLVSFIFVDVASAYYNPSTGRFLGRDPIGEPGAIVARTAVASGGFISRDPVTGPSALNCYIYPNNAPMNWLDPDGLTAQETQPTTPPKPVNVGTYVCGDREKNFFEEIVKTRSGHSIRAKNGQGIIDALTGRCAEDTCISKWVHAQHGWYPNSAYGKSVGGGFGGGQTGEGTGFYCKDPNPQPEDGGRAKGGRSLGDLKTAITSGKVKFCDSCTIYIYGCEVSAIGSFAKDLSCITKCTVYAGSGKVSTAHPDGSAGAGRDPWRAEGGWDTYKGCKKQNSERGPIYIKP